MPLKAVKWLLMQHRPLVLRPHLDWPMVFWILAMLRNCTAARYELNKSRMVRLAEYSRDCLDELRAEMEAFNNALVDFPGTVLFTSHDHQFTQTIANRIADSDEQPQAIGDGAEFDFVHVLPKDTVGGGPEIIGCVIRHEDAVARQLI